MKLWSIFQKNIKYYRYKNSYSQEKLGELTDLSARYISAIECGRYSPTIDTIERIANALGVDGYELFKKLDNYDELEARIDIYRKKQKNKDISN
jgi:transcriptional regulator with XRE-family HTH domain